MNINVFVKRVPDTESKIRISHESKSVIEEGLSFIISPYDEFAVEEALRLKAVDGGTVRVFTVGKEESMVVLRKCLAMGADEAVLIKDPSPETFDALRTAKIIARTLEKKYSGFDLLFFGKQSVDTDNAQVPSMTAELLGLPQVNVVTKLEIKGSEGFAYREIEGGTEKTAFTLPAVVSAQKGLNEPRYETLKGIMAAKKKEIPVILLEDLGLDAKEVASHIEISALEIPPQRKAGKTLKGEPADSARELVRLLRQEAKVI